MNFRKGVKIFLLFAILATWLVPLLHPVLHYDELSAVSRAVEYPILTDQWEYGIKPDGHPPLLQLIIWGSIQIAGIQPVFLRLIGIIFGLWAVWIGYKLSLQLTFNKKQPIPSRTLVIALFRTRRKGQNTLPAAIFTLLLLGLWWWSVSIGYQVRPYSIALPFVLKTWAWAFSTIPNSTKKSYLLVLKIAFYTLMCAWIHHFAFLSCLTAGIVFFTRLFTSSQKHNSTQSNFLKTSFIHGLIFTGVLTLGYYPLFGILTSQLNEGGLSWLGKPQPMFLFDFICENFHSLWVLLLVTLTAIACFTHTKTSLILLGSFLFQYLVLHFYSLLSKPVLQPSSLYFSIPLLFFMADIGWKKTIDYLISRRWQKQKLLQSLVTFSPLILATGMLIDSTLLQKWFTLRQKNYHHQFAQQILHNPKNQHLWFDAEIETIEFHLDKPYNSYINTRCISECKKPSDILNLLTTLDDGDSLIVCSQAGSQPWLLPYLSIFFNSVSVSNNFIGGQIIRFAGYNRNKQLQNPFRCDVQLANLQFPNNNKTARNCGYYCPIPLLNDTLIYNTSDTINFRYTIELQVLKPKPNDVIVVIAPVEWKSHYSGLIVESTLHNDHSQIDWRGTLFQDFQQPNCYFGIHTIKLSDIPGWNHRTQLGINVFGAWAWVGIWQGNPFQYGVTPYISDISLD